MSWISRARKVEREEGVPIINSRGFFPSKILKWNTDFLKVIEPSNFQNFRQFEPKVVSFLNTHIFPRFLEPIIVSLWSFEELRCNLIHGKFS